ncbi:hypothetical protein Cantr_04536 [Candida viswanathii]|uniref:Uncharacterized protein n=1 Tax=Candida viswanathii TaxID=5486 RepID=A0A367XNY4_9ASCO|nr:hypothetical protein Cantr_04536 [Candida viswanathii]
MSQSFKKVQSSEKPHKHSLYDLYYFHFPFIMLTRAETVFLHGFLLGLMSLALYGIIAYLPSTLMFTLSRAYYYLYGADLGPATGAYPGYEL